MRFTRFAFAACALAASFAQAQTAGPPPLLVTTTADNPTAPTAGMLRFALQFAAGSCSISPPPSPNLITFAIPGTGPFKIQPTAPLPPISCSTIIDGYSQAGSSPNSLTGDGTNAKILIEIDGTACGTACTSGFSVAAPGAFFQGLSIHSFRGPAITGSVTSSLNVQGNFIGVDPAGNGFGNAGAGVDFAGGGGFLTVGGDPLTCSGSNTAVPIPAAGCRNLIGANTGPGVNVQSTSTGVSVINNLIGGALNGTAGNGNGGAGIQSAGSASISGNYIRYNTGAGIAITSTFIHNIQKNASIFGNGGLGIDYGVLGSRYPPPVTFFTYDSVTNTTTVKATVSGEPPTLTLLTPPTIDLYSNAALPPFGEGQSLLTTATLSIDSAGNGSVGPFTFPGRLVSVTGTFTSCGDGCFGTSQFSNPDSPPQLTIQFPTNPIALGSTGSLVLQVLNPNKSRTLSSVGYTFTLPPGLTIGPFPAAPAPASPVTLGSDCSPSVVVNSVTSTSVTISNMTLTPNPSANMSCTVGMPLTPTAGGTYSFPANAVVVESDAGPGANAAASLTVTTTPGISVTPTSLNFGTIQTGTSSSLTVTVQSNGTAPLDVTGATVTGAAYAITGNTCSTGMVAPAACTITVRFSPTVLGALSGQLAIASSGTPNPFNVPLSGSGGAPGLVFTPATVTFAAQNVGTTSAAQTVVLSNTGTVSLTISSITASGDFGFTGCGVPLTLAPGASCNLSVTYSPQANGPATGSIIVTSNSATSPNALPLSGSGVNGPAPGMSVPTIPVNFGTVRVGTPATARVTVLSNGTAPLSISLITVGTLAIPGVSFTQTNNCPASLPVGATCDINLTYIATVVGTHNGSLVIQSNAGSVSIPLTGTSVAQLPAALSVVPSLDFGRQVIGTTAKLGLDLRNTGEQALNVTSLTVNGTAFGVQGTCASIAAGATCTVTIVFSPTAVSAYTGSVRIASNDPRGTVTVGLAGEGIAVPRPEISMTPDGVGFANQMITTLSAAQTVTVKNVGSAPLTIHGIGTSGSFSLVGNGCPATLAAGAQCDLGVAFLPVTLGNATGRLTVDSDAGAGRGFASLSGNGCGFFSVFGMRNLVRLCSP